MLRHLARRTATTIFSRGGRCGRKNNNNNLMRWLVRFWRRSLDRLEIPFLPPGTNTKPFYVCDHREEGFLFSLSLRIKVVHSTAKRLTFTHSLFSSLSSELRRGRHRFRTLHRSLPCRTRRARTGKGHLRPLRFYARAERDEGIAVRGDERDGLSRRRRDGPRRRLDRHLGTTRRRERTDAHRRRVVRAQTHRRRRALRRPRRRSRRGKENPLRLRGGEKECT